MTKFQCLDEIYLDELSGLLNCIKLRKVEAQIMQLLAASYSHMKKSHRDSMMRELRAERSRAEGPTLSPLNMVTPEVRERILEIRKKTRSKANG